MNKTKQCFIMGLPNAGKTTYLAALWYSLVHSQNQNLIKLKSMGNDQYLYSLSKRWANVEKLDRTLQGHEKINISINVVDNEGNEYDMRFPDMSGETFQSQYENRKISTDIADYIGQANGILMFINVDEIKEPNFIAQIDEELRPPENQGGGEVKSVKRDPKKDDPTQVQIIELLQFVEFIRKNQSTNLGVVLSAWDLVREINLDITPEVYLMDRMNMLWQYLQSKSGVFNTIFWGVSALGGRYEKEDKLLDISEPMDRILVVNNKNEVYHDITSLIFQIVGGRNSE